MEYKNLSVSRMDAGDMIEGFFMVNSAHVKTASNGKLFMSLSLSDATGSIDAKLWDNLDQISVPCEGKIVKIRGEVSDYRGSKQLSIKQIRLMRSDDNVTMESIINSAPIDYLTELDYIRSIINSIEDEDYRNVCSQMLKLHLDTFSNIPAGKSVHHAFIHGLLMHTSNMLKIADFLSSEIYPDAVDRSLLLAGTLLHDFAKDREYIISEYGLITDVTTEGALLGHLVMGAEEVGTICEGLSVSKEKTVLLKHMLLSHHGAPEYGAAVVPCIAESELLSYIDLIDSRMEIYAETFEHLEKGTFSERIWSLEKRIFNHL